MNNFRVLVTKKISASHVLQAGLKGIQVLEKEFIRIVPVINKELNKKISRLSAAKNTVVFTSRNAVAAVADNSSVRDADWKIFCLEGATRNEVEKHFPRHAIAGCAANSALLAEIIADGTEEKTVTFFCGNKRMEDLPMILLSKKIDVDEVVVYNTELLPQKIIDDYEAVAFFSPSAVESFFSSNELKRGVVCIAVGKTTTEAIKKYTGNEVITSEKPSEQSVLELAIKQSKH
jgi:uroporphyrinogen-III synthase